MDKVGEKLKAARLDKGVSLEEVHKHTRIHLNVLRAIEDDTYINVSPIYLRGFVKMYAQYLGIDPAALLKDHKEPLVTVTASDQEDKAVTFLKPPVRRSRPWLNVRTVSVAVALLVGLLVLSGLVRFVAGAVSRFNARRAQQAAGAPARATAKTPPKATARPPAKPSATPAVRPARPVSRADNAPAAPVAGTAAQPPASPKSDISSPILMGIHAKDDCWMQVKVDGKIVFQGVLNRGRMENWQARDKIELSLGSAGSVDLEINGERTLPLGRKGQVVKNILINRDGLNVPR